ncbi:hypothetical protein AB0I39_07970 [Kitasatospora purpeofusca]|uniref:hypothetical protein n=1 Tax=Kitasatospora purpeofusca TaxID=67352 RepID=UPI0033D808B7
MPPTTQPSPAVRATEALRLVCEHLRNASGPAEVADLVEAITRDGGTLEALSDALATASRWVKDAPGGNYLWQPLALAADEIWQAGTDITDTPERLRSVAARPARIRSSAARPVALPAPAPPQPNGTGPAPRRR